MMAVKQNGPFVLWPAGNGVSVPVPLRVVRQMALDHLGAAVAALSQAVAAMEGQIGELERAMPWWQRLRVAIRRALRR
jgi:hypothetical protein